MDKLEVGMYVRTEYGIEKIKLIDENFMDGDTTFIATDNDEFRGAYNGKLNGFTTRNNVIKKASHNIIDLIEVGDYVNGHQVYEVDRVCCRITLNGGDIGSEAFRLTYLRPALGKNMGIKSIVTKEQFSNMEYRIGD